MKALSKSEKFLKLSLVIYCEKIGPGLNLRPRPKPSSIKSISLNKIATSKSNSFTGPQATSAARSGVLHNCSKVYFSFN